MRDLSRMQDWPELPALGLLVTLSASAQSIGQAAEAMGLAQPNASRSLRNLERELHAVWSPERRLSTGPEHCWSTWCA